MQSVPRPVDIADLRDALGESCVPARFAGRLTHGCPKGGGQGSIAPKSAAPTVSTVQTRHRSDMLDAATTDGERPLKSLTQADVHVSLIWRLDEVRTQRYLFCRISCKTLSGTSQSIKRALKASRRSPRIRDCRVTTPLITLKFTGREVVDCVGMVSDAHVFSACRLE